MPDMQLTGMTQGDLVKFLARKTGRAFIPYNSFSVSQGTPAAGTVGGILTGALMFDAAADESASTLWNIPKDLDVTKPINAYVLWSSAGTTTAHAAIWNISFLGRKAGEDMGDALTVKTTTQVDSTTADVLMITDAMVIPANTLENTDDGMILAVTRDGDATFDTVSVDAAFYGVLLTYESTPSISAE